MKDLQSTNEQFPSAIKPNTFSVAYFQGANSFGGYAISATGEKFKIAKNYKTRPSAVRALRTVAGVMI